MANTRLIAQMRIWPWIVGVLLSAAAMLLGYDAGSEVARLLGGEPGLLARIGKGFVWGGVMGALQWPVVRSARVPPMRFLLASAAGFAIGYPLGQTVQLIVASQWSLVWTGYYSALATFGLCLGLPQGLAFRRHVRRGALWIPFSMAGWMLSGAAWSTTRIDLAEAGIYGAVSGLGLVWLVLSSRPVGVGGVNS